MFGAFKVAAVAAGAMLGVEAAPTLCLRVGVHTVPDRSHALARSPWRLRIGDDCLHEHAHENADHSRSESPHLPDDTVTRFTRSVTNAPLNH